MGEIHEVHSGLSKGPSQSRHVRSGQCIFTILSSGQVFQFNHVISGHFRSFSGQFKSFYIHISYIIRILSLDIYTYTTRLVNLKGLLYKPE